MIRSNESRASRGSPRRRASMPDWASARVSMPGVCITNIIAPVTLIRKPHRVRLRPARQQNVLKDALENAGLRRCKADTGASTADGPTGLRAVASPAAGPTDLAHGFALTAADIEEKR